MSPQEIKSKSPRVWDYLLENKSVLEDRDGGSMDGDDWYAYTYPKSLHEHEKQKIITPEISDNCSFTLDGRGNYSTSVIYSITASETEYDLEYLLAVLNSTTTWFYVSNTSHVLRGGYYRFKTGYLRPVGIPEVDTGEGDSSELDDVKERYQSQEYDVIRKRAIGLAEEGKEATVYNLLCYLVNERIEAQNQYESLNLDLSDHLGNYSEGDALHQIQGYQPPSDVSNTLVSETSGSRDSLRVGRVSVDRDRSKLTIKASARYKPEDEDAYETDQWGYTETELMPALEFVGLDEKYEKLISEFVPHIVNECDDGVAKFREKATKTNSLVDRLESLTLPDLSDIEDSFDRYLGIKTKADGLQIKAENTDDIINQIVYRLYGMTDDEIEIVEDSESE
jgi:hypothetical protein